MKKQQQIEYPCDCRRRISEFELDRKAAPLGDAAGLSAKAIVYINPEIRNNKIGHF